MRKVKKQVWLAVSAAFVAGNLYLIFKEDSKAGRTEWLTDWKRAETGDVVESFSAEGVVAPSDEYPVYFDASQGPLDQIFVKEGDPVQPGTPLFSYASRTIDEEIARLTAEQEEAQQQISFVESEIIELELLLSEAESEEESTETPFFDDTETTTVIQSGDASTGVQSEILRRETERQTLEEKVIKYDTLIAAQEEKKSELTVESIHEGYVKKIDTSLNNPIVTISSSVPAVEGVFDEKQVAQAESGQRVEVTVDTTLEQFGGVLGVVSTYPEEEPSVKRKSLYPFSAQLSGVESSDLYSGLKANVKVVTEEETDVVTVPGTALLKKNEKTYAVIMNRQGQLERRAIETGLHVDGVYHVASGLKAGETVVLDPYSLIVKSGPFITPIDTDSVKKKQWNRLSRTEKIKYTLIGLLS